MSTTSLPCGMNTESLTFSVLLSVVSDVTDLVSELNPVCASEPHPAIDSVMAIARMAAKTFFFLIVILLYYYIAYLNRRKSAVHPFTAPIITPLMKYFCMNGYTASIGALDTIMREYFKSSDRYCLCCWELISRVAALVRST